MEPTEDNDDSGDYNDSIDTLILRCIVENNQGGTKCLKECKYESAIDSFVTVLNQLKLLKSAVTSEEALADEGATARTRENDENRYVCCDGVVQSSSIQFESSNRHSRDEDDFDEIIASPKRLLIKEGISTLSGSFKRTPKRIMKAGAGIATLTGSFKKSLTLLESPSPRRNESKPAKRMVSIDDKKSLSFSEIPLLVEDDISSSSRSILSTSSSSCYKYYSNDTSSSSAVYHDPFLLIPPTQMSPWSSFELVRTFIQKSQMIVTYNLALTFQLYARSNRSILQQSLSSYKNDHSSNTTKNKSTNSRGTCVLALPKIIAKSMESYKIAFEMMMNSNCDFTLSKSSNCCNNNSCSDDDDEILFTLVLINNYMELIDDVVSTYTHHHRDDDDRIAIDDVNYKLRNTLCYKKMVSKMMDLTSTTSKSLRMNNGTDNKKRLDDDDDCYGRLVSNINGLILDPHTKQVVASRAA